MTNAPKPPARTAAGALDPEHQLHACQAVQTEFAFERALAAGLGLAAAAALLWSFGYAALALPALALLLAGVAGAQGAARTNGSGKIPGQEYVRLAEWAKTMLPQAAAAGKPAATIAKQGQSSFARAEQQTVRAQHLLQGLEIGKRRSHLDQVADLHVVEVLQADAALDAGLHLGHVVLEPAERTDAAGPEHLAATHEDVACLARLGGVDLDVPEQRQHATGRLRQQRKGDGIIPPTSRILEG